MARWGLQSVAGAG